MKKPKPSNQSPTAPEPPSPADIDAAAGQLGDDQQPGTECNGGTVSDGNDVLGDLEQLRQQLLRSQADFDNYRKRMQRDLEQERRYAIVPLLRDLLPVVDNIQRATQAGTGAEDAEGLRSGVELIASQLISVLEQHNCHKIEANGVAFDPHVHEAISQIPTVEQPPGTIVNVVQEGYAVHDRVVRPSRVIIAAPAAQEESPSTTDTPPGEDNSSADA